VLSHIRSFGIWIIGSVFFCFACVIVIICILILSRERTGKILRFLFNILLWLVGIKLEVTGRKHILPDKPYLIMGNHQSLFDVFVIPAAVPIYFVALEAARHFSYPFFGYVIRKWGNIPIARNDLSSARKSLDRAKETILSGISILVMPEGHRTLTGDMQPFKKGPFHLAKAARADILPFGIKGLYRFNPKGSFHIQPGVVTVRFGKPIDSDRINDLTVEQARDMVFNQIKKLST